jgi:dihydroorotate dehydrogenase
MDSLRIREHWETLEGEHLKTATEFGLHALSKYSFGQRVLELARGGERIEDSRLRVEVAGLSFENPVMVGAGWDKKGWAVDGLYELGFSGAEVGSVLLHPQHGNLRPRLWYTQGVGLNRMGFNSAGALGVAENLSRQDRKGITGINISRNKLSAENHSPEDFAAVADILYDYADYFVINFMSPNTPGLRASMMRLLGDSIDAVSEAQEGKVKRPIFIKTAVDMSEQDILDTIQIATDKKAAGIIDTNTTVEEAIKEHYGWEGELGGVSGNDVEYRVKAVERMKFITKESRGTGLVRVGVGAISNSASAIERIQSGAQLVQVVTGIRQNKAKAAQNINRGILAYMEKEGFKDINDMVGVAAYM